MLSSIRSVGIMLADKTPGPFSLRLLEFTPVAQSPEATPTVDRSRAITTVLEGAISEGVPLFNGGAPARCYDVYRTAIASILTLAPDHLKPAHRALFSTALARAKSQTSASDQAWTLRTAMDTVLGNPN